MEERITDLEIRIAHQEAAIDELTRTLLAQERLLKGLAGEVDRLRRVVRELSPPLVGAAADEPPPPHY